MNNIEVFSNYTDDEYKEYVKRTELWKGKHLLTPLVVSTITIRGEFKNVSFHESNFIKEIDPTMVDEMITNIKCNYGEIENGEFSNANNVKKSFNSQITFTINPDDKKIYKMKLFRSGIFQIAGITKVDLTDSFIPINIIYKFLKTYFESISIGTISSILRNYRCNMLKYYNKVKTNKLYEKVIPFTNKANAHFNYKDVIHKFTKEWQSGIIKRVQKLCGSIIDTVQLNESYATLKLKRSRPGGKSITVEIHKSGKVNINACLCHPEALELYEWVNYLLRSNRDCIIDYRIIC